MDVELSETHDSDNEDDGSVACKVLALCVVQKGVGVAFYDELTNSIRADSFQTCPEELEGMLATVKMICEPTLILIQPHVIVNKSLLDVISSGWDGVPDRYLYQTIKTMHWNLNNSLESMCTKLFVKSNRNHSRIIESLTYQVFSNFSFSLILSYR